MFERDFGGKAALNGDRPVGGGESAAILAELRVDMTGVTSLTVSPNLAGAQVSQRDRQFRLCPNGDNGTQSHFTSPQYGN